ncbi:hypothetical protein MPSEU_000392900 [Mayamaea pseudoterrestris]|nr:hypothetical protein MPSEU_000392900 [Mayamaea pseudoterrestris]
MTDEAVAVEASAGGKNRKPRERDETPIEELYDLSKPIPRVEKPDKSKYDAMIVELTETIENLKTDRQAIQDKVDLAMDNPEAKARLQVARTELNQLKSQRNELITEKKAMRALLDSAKESTDKLVKEKKDAKSNMKFGTVEEIDAAVAKLKRQQETTTMSLNDEKRLIKEMEALQGSKRFVTDLKSKDQAMESVKEQRKAIQQRMAAKDKEIDEVSSKIDAVMAVIKEISDADTKKRESLNELFKKRDGIKITIGETLKKRDSLRDEIRELNNVWYNYQRAVRAQKKAQYEAEKKVREEQHAAELAKLEEEEAKKIPYEEEQALCAFLADFLEKTYLAPSADEVVLNENKSDAVTPVNDDPFAGLRPVNKKEEDDYFGKGKSKKKRVRDKKQDNVSGPFTLSVDTFEQFGLLNLDPPTSIDQVSSAVKELRAKKEWYSAQPRGSVPTAKEMRKVMEKNAKSSGNVFENGASASASKPGKTFNLADDDFVPLGAGASSGVNSVWGQKFGSYLQE